MADAEKWLFRGEGNACLVLVNSEEKLVYRLAKSKHWGKGQLATSAMNKVDRIHEELQHVIDYMRDVIQPLLSQSFVVLPELCLIGGGIIQDAEKQIQTSRPAQRKGRDVEHCTVDPTTLSALVMPDLCYVRGTSKTTCTLPTLSVEIKPKKAFMQSPVSSSSLGEKSQVCRFCMHQRLKAKEGQWPETSRYCPLDLFSGNRRRMKQALCALAETPQNNLRICQDGEEILGAWKQEDLNEVLTTFFGDGTSNGLHTHKLLQVFLDLITEALLSVPEDMDLVDSDILPTPGSHSDVLSSVSTCQTVQYCHNSRYTPDINNCSERYELPKGCVLERIYSLQRLDNLDIDGVFPLYQQLDKHCCDNPTLRSRLSLDGPYSQSDWLQPCIDKHCVDEDFIIEKNIYSMANKVKRFLVSKTVQDCSIMVALQRVPDSCNEENGGGIIKDSCGRMFHFTVTIIDLDPKPFSKIPIYHKQDREITNAYREAVP